jgi:hypothetical protein
MPRLGYVPDAVWSHLFRLMAHRHHFHHFVSGGAVMHRTLVLARSVVLLLVLLALGSLARPSAAQDATPPAQTMEIAPGVTAEEVPTELGNPPVFRIHLDPGAAAAFDDTDPSLSLVYVEEGTVTFTIAAPVSVTRGGAEDQSAEPILAAVEFTAGPGDYFIAPANTAAELRNDGTDPATILVASIVPRGAGMDTTSASGTPASGG